MTKHTPGPWVVRGGFSIYAADGKTPVADTCLNNSVATNDEANARRIVSCVNAMEGINDDNTIFLTGNSVRRVIVAMEIKRQQIEAQRDELLDVLKEVLNCDKTRTSFGAVMRARAAIDKATNAGGV